MLNIEKIINNEKIIIIAQYNRVIRRHNKVERRLDEAKG